MPEASPSISRWTTQDVSVSDGSGTCPHVLPGSKPLNPPLICPPPPDLEVGANFVSSISPGWFPIKVLLFPWKSRHLKSKSAWDRGAGASGARAGQEDEVLVLLLGQAGNFSQTLALQHASDMLSRTC